MNLYGRFSEITNMDQLLAIEDDLLNQEDENPSDEAKEELIRLYRRMWELQPEEDRYEQSIAQLLLRLGWDMKMRRVNYEKARSFFEKLIRLKKPMLVPIAHYRLGFIHYHNKQWDRAITNFKLAIGGDNRSRQSTAETWAKLDVSQTFKANARLAMAYKYRSIEVARQANDLYENRDLDEASIFYHQELNSEIELEEQKPYLCLSAGKVTPMDSREYRSLIEQEEAVVLDYTNFANKYVYVSGVYRQIIGRNLDILRKLLLSSEPIPQWKLEHDIGIRQASVYINRLKAFLRECGLESDAITADNGYKWIHPNSYMVYRSDDPDYMF